MITRYTEDIMTYQQDSDSAVRPTSVGETMGVFSLFLGAVMLMSVGSFLPSKMGDFSSPQRHSSNDQTLAPPTSLSVAPGSGHSSEDTPPLGI